jgi:hypothetical protein
MVVERHVSPRLVFQGYPAPLSRVQRLCLTRVGPFLHITALHSPFLLNMLTISLRLPSFPVCLLVLLQLLPFSFAEPSLPLLQSLVPPWAIACGISLIFISHDA